MSGHPFPLCMSSYVSVICGTLEYGLTVRFSDCDTKARALTTIKLHKPPEIRMTLTLAIVTTRLLISGYI